MQGLNDEHSREIWFQPPPSGTSEWTGFCAIHNQLESSKDPYLRDLFILRPGGQSHGLYALLSHARLAIGVLAFMKKALWSVPPLANNLQICDVHGRLDLAAVAAHANGVELAEVCKQGLLVDCLSYQN